MASKTRIPLTVLARPRYIGWGNHWVATKRYVPASPRLMESQPLASAVYFSHRDLNGDGWGVSDAVSGLRIPSLKSGTRQAAERTALLRTKVRFPYAPMRRPKLKEKQALRPGSMRVGIRKVAKQRPGCAHV